MIDFGLILSMSVFIIGCIYVAMHFINEDRAKVKQRYIDEPELRYEERLCDENVRSANMNVPTEFKNDGPIEINVRSSSKGPFILVIDGKEAGTIEKHLKFIETLPGMRDITILTKRRRKIYHTIHHVHQFTNITVSGFIIHRVKIKN